MKSNIIYIAVFWSLMVITNEAIGQESIFSALVGDLKKADRLYANQSYNKASSLYEGLLQKDKDNEEVLLKLANSYFFSNKMKLSAQAYNEYEKIADKMSFEVMLRYASALQAVGKYDKALVYLQQYSLSNPNDFEISKKIWQLQNINFLFEDSLYFKVNPISINTTYDEIAPEILGNQLIYASNQPKVDVIKRIEGTSEKPFFQRKITQRTLLKSETERYEYSNDRPFGKELSFKFHDGAISFSPGGDTIAFTRSSVQTGKSNTYPMQLHFAANDNGTWTEIGPFPHNSLSYSISRPVFSDDGKTLYFSSDMPGGMGGKDLYKSTIVQGKWTAPVNLGKEINTSLDEGHPFIIKGVLYFSSNGHPGLGGLDIFKTRLSAEHKEVTNFGYPVNTSFDDFDFVLDSTEITGYLVSNRGADNDNIFEVKLKRMTFPITISGKIKYKKDNRNDSELIDLTYATLELIEKPSMDVILTTTTDTMGDFSLNIPYESKYMLKVVEKEFGEAVVSMEIPKNHLDYLNHDIVIIKE